MAEADWEACKENYQPLKAGRKAGALKDTTAELRSAALEERRKAFWEELDGYSGNDPLEVWLRFIKWTQETFSAGGHKAELLPLLERCTRELQGDARYAADIRYLRVWVQYADCLPDPGDVFSFLKENDIGQEHALYYIAYATYLEGRGGYAKADAVYQQGINRLAAPVERLRAKYGEFQHRMAKRIQRKAAEQAAGETAEPEHPERRSLAVLNSRGGAAGRPAASGARPGGGLLLGGGGGLLGKRKAAAAGTGQENAAGGGLDIFVDDEFSGGGAGAPAASAPAALFQPGRSAAGPWTKLSGFEAGRKENVQRASVWAGQKLKQNVAHSAPAAPALEIFVDPELEELEQAGGRGGGSSDDGSKPTLRQRLDKGGQGGALPEETIMQNPLQLHKAQTSAHLLGGVPGRNPAAAPEAKRRREEVMAFDEAALIGDSGEELSFEEVRAARWLERQRQAQELAAAAAAEAAACLEEEKDLPDMELEGETCAIMAEVDASLGAGESLAGGDGQSEALTPVQQMHVEMPDDVPAACPAGSPQAPSAAAGHQQGAVSPGSFGSPVEMAGLPAHAQQAQHTDDQQRQENLEMAAEQAASPAAQAVFAQASPAAVATSPSEPLAAQPGSFEQPAGHAGEVEPTMTISTHDAFAAINQMFGGLLPADAAPELLGGAASHSGAVAGFGAGLEPTMTIATKDAFAALNKMFKGSLPLEHGSLPPNPYAEPTLQLGRGAGASFGSGPGYEPTMTISTKAAFDAINQMFKGSLPHEHGVLPPTARGPAAGSEPTVTISTRAAFEAINQMFGGGSGGSSGAAAQEPAQQQQHQEGGFRVPAPRPPRTRPPAAAAPAPAPAMVLAPPESSPGGFCIREDTQFVSVPIQGVDSDASPASAAVAAPAAAGFGGGFCIREDTQYITVPAGAEDEAEEMEAAGSGGGYAASPDAGFGGGFCIREDTQFITVAVQPEEEEEEALQGPGLQHQLRAPQPEQLMPAEPAEVAADSGFMIREDTMFVGAGGHDGAAVAGRHASASPSPAVGGFEIREDTQFVGLGSGSGAGFASPAYSSEAGGSTGDLLGADLAGVPTADGSPANSASAVRLNKWGFAPGADDTLALNLELGDGDTQALLDAVGAASQMPAGAVGRAAGLMGGAAVHVQASTPSSAAFGGGGGDTVPIGEAAWGVPTEDLALQMGMQGLQLADVKENVPVGAHSLPGGAGGSGRRLADPAVAAAALQPLGESRMALLGVELEEDEEAEAALAAGLPAEDAERAGLAQQDSFAVWEDPEDAQEGQQHQDQQQGSASPQGRPALGALEAAGEEGFATPVAAQPSAAVDPFSPSFHTRMLSCLDPPVPEWPGVVCLSAEEEEAADAAFGAAGRSAAGLEELQLACGLEFAVSGCIGEGAYARVHQGVDADCADVALKHEAPPCPWEWYICKALAGRLPGAAAARSRFVDPTALLLGKRSSVLVAPLGPHGSLQDLINSYLTRGAPPPECLAMHLAADLLRTMQLLHAARIVHTDIKPDNLLVTLGQAADGDENAGPALGLQLIDFGRSVDLELLPPGALLQGDSGTDAFRCVEMREGAPWVWQADAYGVAASVHAVLFGRYLEVERVQASGTGAVFLRPVQPLKRHWAAELWEPFFHRLLNLPADPREPPAVDDLVASFEAHLSGSRDVVQRLRKALAEAAALLPQRC